MIPSFTNNRNCQNRWGIIQVHGIALKGPHLCWIQAHRTQPRSKHVNIISVKMESNPQLNRVILLRILFSLSFRMKHNCFDSEFYQPVIHVLKSTSSPSPAYSVGPINSSLIPARLIKTEHPNGLWLANSTIFRYLSQSNGLLHEMVFMNSRAGLDRMEFISRFSPA